MFSTISLFLFFCIFLGFWLLLPVIKKYKNNHITDKDDGGTELEPIFHNYQQVPLLTDTEKSFYKELVNYLPSTISINLKVRLADLIMPKKGISNWKKAFNKVCSKHIDFVLIDRATSQVICLIELDDVSHNKKNRLERDEFVNHLCSYTGYQIIHIPVSSSYDLEHIFTGEVIFQPK